MTKIIVAIGLAALAFTSSGCSGQSAIAREPVWVSKNINGLQRSECNCGGVETKKNFKKRKAADAARQAARQNEDGTN